MVRKVQQFLIISRTGFVPGPSKVLVYIATRTGKKVMVAYEFYVRDNCRGDRLIGILPERRKRHDRITDESVFRWASKVFSTMVDLTKVYFVSVTIQQNGRGFYFPQPKQENRSFSTLGTSFGYDKEK